MSTTAAERAAVQRAVELARRGEGCVEPNPMVGAVILDPEGVTISEGWHARFGGPHAEAMALSAAGEAARGATLVVTLEPCCHHGKTPPCTDAILTSGIRRVVVGTRDPSSHASGQGLAVLRAAGVEVVESEDTTASDRLIAPFRMLVTHGRPWVIAKWAISLDGRVATTTGESRWISSEASRAIVHRLRGRVDAILVGIGTALADDPLLTPRPAGPRSPLRIVLDSTARLPLASQLVRTAREHPLLVAVGPTADTSAVERLASAGCEISHSAAADASARLRELLGDLGRRQRTNLLVEGGPAVHGSFFDAGLVDEVWTFVAPRVIGGDQAPAAVGGRGIAAMKNAPGLSIEATESPGGDLFIKGIVRR